MHAIDHARADAKLEAGLQTRRSSRQVLKLILAGDLNVRFEPIVHLETAQVIGYEALTRGPARTELVNPVQLFHEAESAGLLFELDCLCRKLALEQASVLPRGKMLFLNCLPTAIGDPNLRVEGLRKVLENYELRPSDLVLEISESESIENFGVFREVSDSCREVGVRIAIDDAGTGYASLEAIMEITPDFIKTDMGLVRGIDSDPPRQEVVRALASVARGIGAQVIAEGIETDAELRALRELGVRYGQGYFFGAATPGEDPAGEAMPGEVAAGRGRGQLALLACAASELRGPRSHEPAGRSGALPALRTAERLRAGDGSGSHPGRVLVRLPALRRAAARAGRPGERRAGLHLQPLPARRGPPPRARLSLLRAFRAPAPLTP